MLTLVMFYHYWGKISFVLPSPSLCYRGPLNRGSTVTNNENNLVPRVSHLTGDPGNEVAMKIFGAGGWGISLSDNCSEHYPNMDSWICFSLLFNFCLDRPSLFTFQSSTMAKCTRLFSQHYTTVAVN